jgi:hypothetical protein
MPPRNLIFTYCLAYRELDCVMSISMVETLVLERERDKLLLRNEERVEIPETRVNISKSQSAKPSTIDRKIIATCLSASPQSPG